MLVQLPRDSTQPQSNATSEDCGAFEAGLRRDLAMASVISYEPVLGGWLKRSFDLLIGISLLPICLPTLLGVASWLKLTSDGPAFRVEECVGYAGRSFRRLSLRVGDEKTDGAEPPRKPTRLLSKLPQLLNVLVGDMSLVGAEPLTTHELEQLKSAKRYYISARPGIFDIASLVQNDQSEFRFKAYALSWSLMLDLLLIWRGVSGSGGEGALWRRGQVHRLAPSIEAEPEPAPHRRSAP